MTNQIIHTGVFPRQLKIARVKPLFKKGDQSNFSNYRPISLLPSISKIYEQVMAAQLIDYFTSNNLFCIQQFGFRPGYSTELAALRLANHTILEMDNNKVPTNIYIDLSKTFDTLIFDILLAKLDHYGVNESAKRLIHSYLTDRSQYVEFNGHKSVNLPISTGVPQGSVLGPLLFLIYINDLPLVSNVFNMLMYADDTTLYCNIDQCVNEYILNEELHKLTEWLGANKLALNISKTKYMIFHTSNRKITYPNLKINNTNIERVTQFNFLGVMFNSHMDWSRHINYISMKISRSTGILYRLKDIYPQSVLLTLYNTLILPHFHYCLLLWGSTVKDNHPLHLLQKKAVRIIDNSHYIAHTEPICKVHRILKVSDMFSIALWKFYHKLMNNKLPKCFSTIKPNLPVITEHYEIRNPVFHLPAIKHKFAESSLQYCLIKLINEQNCFNEMTDKMQRTSIYSFKFFLKQRVLDTYKLLLIVRVLLFWYQMQNVCIKWGNSYSHYFTICNGVRQGGILSPRLFALYVYQLTDRLLSCNAGCYINDMCLNHVMYADDLCLLAPSASAMQSLLDICYDYGSDNDILFNPIKSVYTIFKPKAYKLYLPSVFIGSDALKYVAESKYLGFSFCDSKQDDNDILRQMRTVYAKSNTLLRTFSHCSTDAKITLFQSYCTALYCPFLWSVYKKSTFRKIRVAFNNAYRKIFGLPKRSSASAMYAQHNICNFETMIRKSIIIIWFYAEIGKQH